MHRFYKFSICHGVIEFSTKKGFSSKILFAFIVCKWLTSVIAQNRQISHLKGEKLTRYFISSKL